MADPGSSPALTERAREILTPFAQERLNPNDISDDSAWNVLTEEIAAALHSASEAAAREERNSWADAIRERQKGKPDLDLAGIKACAEAALIRPGHVIASAREVLAMIELIEASEAAAAEVERLGKVLDTHSRMMHPWYGPCDGLGPEGQCAECLRVLEAAAAEARIDMVEACLYILSQEPLQPYTRENVERRIRKLASPAPQEDRE